MKPEAYHRQKHDHLTHELTIVRRDLAAREKRRKVLAAAIAFDLADILEIRRKITENEKEAGTTFS